MTADVLILCDDLMFVSKVTATGRAANVPVRTARSTESALAKCLTQCPGCVIVDLHTADLDLAEWIPRLNQLAKRPRIVAFGSHVDVARLRAAREAGCDLVMPKSQFTEQLEIQLRHWANLEPINVSP